MEVRRTRAWCFTNYKEVSNIQCEYMTYQHEICPKTGRKHIQGFVYFKNPRAFGGVRKLFDHVEPMKGTMAAAIQYCQKLESRDPDYSDFVELGDRPKQGERTDLADIKKRLDSGESIKSVITKMDVPSYQGLKYAETYGKYINTVVEWRALDVYWFYGKTGTGKTKAAYEMVDKSNCWMSSGDLTFWNGYTDQEYVIIDDFRGCDLHCHALLRVLDKYTYTVNVKGGSALLRAHTIIITSAFSPEATYPKRMENIQQLIRRIKEIRKYVDIDKYEIMSQPNLDQDSDESFYSVRVDTRTEVGGNTSAPTF